MKQYRVTKYNPEFRKADGSYFNDEWTSFSDVGKSVSEDEYKRVENAYIESAINFLEEQGISQLKINNLENAFGEDEPGIELSNGEVLEVDALKVVLKSILREKYWAKLENANAFIHLGYDYYMYVGVPNESKSAQKFAESKGLFVEEFISPYNDNEL
jgi:hypothetical protein